MNYLYLIIALILGAAISWIITKLSLSANFAKAESILLSEKTSLATERDQKIEQLNEKQSEIISLKTKTEELNRKIQEHLQALTKAEEGNKNLQEKLETQKSELTKLQEMFKESFQNLAQEILDNNSQKFKQTNKEEINKLLDPFNKELASFKKQVNDAYIDEGKERRSLKDEVKSLAELNQAITEETRNLTNALKSDSQAQGHWGEVILESILEKSGLINGAQYQMQEYLKDEHDNYLISETENKKMRPDAIVKYPGDRKVIIDAKVSLTAFANYLDATEENTKASTLKKHIASVKSHIDDLNKRGYDDYNQSLDFVVMFMPSEPAYITAMQSDKDLWQYAYDRRILLLSPTNLITSLKLIVDLWAREIQNKNAEKIADRGRKLFQKFVGFVENFQAIETSLKTVQNKYDTAWKQLSDGKGNLISQAKTLKELAAVKTSDKKLPEGDGGDD